MKTLLISLHPRHSQNILSGKKTIELRKKLPSEVARVVFYETFPTKAIVGLFSVGDIVSCTVDGWVKRSDQLCLLEREIRTYLSSGVGIGLLINKVHELRKIHLVQMQIRGINAPQSYRYLSEEMIETLGIKFND